MKNQNNYRRIEISIEIMKQIFAILNLVLSKIFIIFSFLSGIGFSTELKQYCIRFSDNYSQKIINNKFYSEYSQNNFQIKIISKNEIKNLNFPPLQILKLENKNIFYI